MDDGSSSTSADFVRSRSWRYVDGISVHRKGRVSVVSWGFGSFAESWNTARAPDVGAFAHVTASADGASGQLTWLDRNGQPHVVILTKPIGSDDPYLCVPTADRCRVAIADAILAHSRLPWLTGVQLANHVLARLEIEHHRMESTSVARSALSNARGKLDYLIHPIAAAVDRYWR